jgi:hypothetical protein
LRTCTRRERVRRRRSPQPSFLGIRRRRTCSLCGASPESSNPRGSEDAEHERVVVAVRRRDSQVQRASPVNGDREPVATSRVGVCGGDDTPGASVPPPAHDDTSRRPAGARRRPGPPRDGEGATTGDGSDLGSSLRDHGSRERRGEDGDGDRDLHRARPAELTVRRSITDAHRASLTSICVPAPHR